MGRQAEIWGLRTWGLPRMLNSPPLPLYISHPRSLSPRCALQPIWRLINPEGLLFRWGFSSLSPHCTPSILTSLAPFPTQPASHHPPLPAYPSISISIHTYTHSLSHMHLIPASPILSPPPPQGRHGAVPESRTEVTDVLCFLFFFLHL